MLPASLGFSLAAMTAPWLVSLRLRDASIVDIWWGPGFAAIAALCHGLAPAGGPARGGLLVLLSALWGLRLGAYLLWRNAGRGEDRRYQAMRRRRWERSGRSSSRSGSASRASAISSSRASRRIPRTPAA
jgi:steroid 5-alpha reductase family enzyme